MTAGTLAEGDYLVNTVTGTITNAGTEVNTLSDVKVMHGEGEAAVDVTANYQITKQNGELKITPVKIVLTADSANKVYDGKALTKDSYKITTGAFVGEEGLASVTVEGSQTLVGSSDNTITGHTLKENTKAQNYEISYVKGTLTVTQASVRPLQLKLMMQRLSTMVIIRRHIPFRSLQFTRK